MIVYAHLSNEGVKGRRREDKKVQSIEDFGECGKDVYIYTNLDHLQRTIMCVERVVYSIRCYRRTWEKR